MSEAVPQISTGLRISRRHFVVGATLAAATLGSQAALPKVQHAPIPAKLFTRWVPGNFGAWKYEVASGMVLPPPDILSDRLYDNLVTKIYTKPGQPAVMMLIAYNYQQDGVVQVHRPEVCYPAGGYILSPTRQVTLTVAPNREIPANIFSAVSPERTEQVAYWTRIGSRFPRTWLDQRWSVMASNLQGAIPDGVLMRFSVIDNDPVRSETILREFVTEFFHAAGGPLRRVLIGQV